MANISVVMGVRGRKYYDNWKRMLTADEVIPAVDDMFNRRENYLTFNDAMGAATGEWIVFCGERQRFKQNWREILENEVPWDYSGIVKIGLLGDNDLQAGMITRDYLNKIKWLFHPDYIHYWADIETWEMAEADNKTKQVNLIEEVAPKGDTQGTEHYAWDAETYQMRKKLGFPREGLGRNRFAV